MPLGAYDVTRYKAGEEAALYTLYRETTHRILGRDYTPEQCERWAPLKRDMTEWALRLRSQNPFVARKDGQIVGFGELEPNGHIDFFYVHHDWQRRGVGVALYQAIEEEALRQNIQELYLESSVTAKPFFLRMGFQIQEKRENIICGAPAPQFLMRKRL